MHRAIPVSFIIIFFNSLIDQLAYPSKNTISCTHISERARAQIFARVFGDRGIIYSLQHIQPFLMFIISHRVTYCLFRITVRPHQWELFQKQVPFNLKPKKFASVSSFITCSRFLSNVCHHYNGLQPMICDDMLISSFFAFTPEYII